MKKILITASFAIFCSLLLIQSGCNSNAPNIVKVTGKITYENEPLKEANVSFVPVSESDGELHATGMTDENGMYTIKPTAYDKSGTTPGEYIVVIRKTNYLPTGVFDTDSGTGEKTERTTKEEILPDKYMSKNKTELRAKVQKSGENVFNFDLSK